MYIGQKRNSPSLCQVSWSVPEVGQIIDLVRLSQSLDELEARHDSQSPKAFQVGPGQPGRGVELGG